MPIYEYKCLNCGHKFETLIWGKVPKLAGCPECGAVGKKVPSLFNFSFGWVLDNVDRFQDDLPRRDI